MNLLLQVVDPANIGAFFTQLQVDVHRPAFWLAVGKIIWINVLLSGDNALVIAMACRGLHGRHRDCAVLLGQRDRRLIAAGARKPAGDHRGRGRLRQGVGCELAFAGR